MVRILKSVGDVDIIEVYGCMEKIDGQTKLQYIYKSEEEALKKQPDMDIVPGFQPVDKNGLVPFYLDDWYSTLEETEQDVNSYAHPLVK